MAGSSSRERADAARNRAAILRATERLLAERGAEHASLDTVAAAAGVGKGTVFRRFGSRTGLLNALLHERMAALRTGIESGPLFRQRSSPVVMAFRVQPNPAVRGQHGGVAGQRGAVEAAGAANGQHRQPPACDGRTR